MAYSSEYQKREVLTTVDQGYTGDQPEQAAAKQGIPLVVVKPPDAKHGFVLLHQHWVVERSSLAGWHVFAVWQAIMNAYPIR